MDDSEALGRLVLGLGAEARDINTFQMGVRAVIVYVVTVAMVRLGKKRFMGQATAFDVILGIMLGSVVGRAITGNAPFLPAIAAGAVLLAMHWLFSGVALRWPAFGSAVKGHSEILVRDGVIDWKLMKNSHMTERDLWEDLRGQSVSRLEEVAEAHMEPSGKLSVIKAKPEPKVIEVTVQDGVQTVRFEPAAMEPSPRRPDGQGAAMEPRGKPIMIPVLRAAGGLSILAAGIPLAQAVLESRLEPISLVLAGFGAVTGILLLGFAANLAILHDMRGQLNHP